MKNKFLGEPQKVPMKINNISEEQNFLIIEREKADTHNYLLSLQKKLREGEILEEDLDEEEYVELELLYKQQIEQVKKMVKSTKTRSLSS